MPAWNGIEIVRRPWPEGVRDVEDREQDKERDPMRGVGDSHGCA